MQLRSFYLWRCSREKKYQALSACTSSILRSGVEEPGNEATTYLLLKTGDQGASLYRNSFLAHGGFSCRSMFIKVNLDSLCICTVVSCSETKSKVVTKKKHPLLYVAHDLRFQVLDGLW